MVPIRAIHWNMGILPMTTSSQLISCLLLSTARTLSVGGDPLGASQWGGPTILKLSLHLSANLYSNQ